MRERTTWNREKLAEIVKAANNKVAEDPRAMNQDHLSQQPAADKYEIGGPSDFAEDVAPSDWKAEYSGGEVKRNELGMPEMRGDTFNHAEKTAAEQQEQDDEVLEKKASLCIKLAKRVLTKTASESMIEDQAVAFMHMPDAALIESVNRLAAEEDEQEEKQQKQAQDQQQSEDEQKKQAQAQQQQQADEEKKQAGQIPENFKKKDEDDKGEQQQKQSGQIPENFKKKDEDEGEQQQQKQAQQQQDEDKEEQQKQAFVAFKKACDAMAQGMGVPQDQVMALFQQALGGGLQQPMAQQQVQQVQQQPMGDDQLLDQMLQDEGQQPVMANLDDIQLEGASMDTGEIKLGSEDEVLNTLFASHEEVRNANHANALTSGIPMAAPGMTRTASTRTVGTRPTVGVSQLGGTGSSATSGSDVDKLSSLWQSAPDVKGVFS